MPEACPTASARQSGSACHGQGHEARVMDDLGQMGLQLRDMPVTGFIAGMSLP
ncbi:MAG: hypothetical protein SOX46_04060 [Clostridiaceae bacterium]|nr:hypothetical protein [Clostridiaceae bacterium]